MNRVFRDLASADQSLDAIRVANSWIFSRSNLFSEDEDPRLCNQTLEQDDLGSIEVDDVFW